MRVVVGERKIWLSKNRRRRVAGFSKPIVLYFKTLASQRYENQ